MAGSPTGCPFHRDLAGRLDQAPDMAQASHRPQYLKGGEDVAGDAKAGDERMEREARRGVTQDRRWLPDPRRGHRALGTGTAVLPLLTVHL